MAHKVLRHTQEGERALNRARDDHGLKAQRGQGGAQLAGVLRVAGGAGQRAACRGGAGAAGLLDIGGHAAKDALHGVLAQAVGLVHILAQVADLRALGQAHHVPTLDVRHGKAGGDGSNVYAGYPGHHCPSYPKITSPTPTYQGYSGVASEELVESSGRPSTTTPVSPAPT